MSQKVYRKIWLLLFISLLIKFTRFPWDDKRTFSEKRRKASATDDQIVQEKLKEYS